MDERDAESFFDEMEEQYLIDSDKDGMVEYSPEGGDQVEFAYKVMLAEDILNEDKKSTWAIEIITLTRIYNDIMEAHSEKRKARESFSEERDGVDPSANKGFDMAFRVLVADDVFLFYTLANEFIKGLSSEIISDELFDKRDSNMEDTLIDLKQSELAEMLYYSGIVDNGTKSEMENVNITRNKLVHQFKNRHYLDPIQDIVPMIDRVADVIDELHEISEGYRPFED